MTKPHATNPRAQREQRAKAASMDRAERMALRRRHTTHLAEHGAPLATGRCPSCGHMTSDELQHACP